MPANIVSPLMALAIIMLAAYATAAGVGNITETPHKGPDAPLDVELVYRPQGNTQCGGTAYKFHTFRYAAECFTFDNPTRALQIGLQADSNQIGLNNSMGCLIYLFKNANCSFGTPDADGHTTEIIGTLPQGDNYTTYGTCYSSSIRALSANVGCGP